MIEVIDLFCGAGGLSLGLKNAGLIPRLGVDISTDSLATYQYNFPEARTLCEDIASLKVEELTRNIDNRDNFILAGCPPCQLFSKLHRRHVGKSKEISSYIKIIRALKPRYIIFENVPRIAHFEKVWGPFNESLKILGYKISTQEINMRTIGIPQNRTRLILIASLDSLPSPRLKEVKEKTVRDAIGHLPFADSSIPNHISMSLSEANLLRIKNIQKDGGSGRRDSKSFIDSYSRMYWDRPAPTITTKCVSFSNGRFGHPEYHRAITVREAAYLQGFPSNFIFQGNLTQTARQVGNAVPPPLGKLLGYHILKHST